MTEKVESLQSEEETVKKSSKYPKYQCNLSTEAARDSQRRKIPSKKEFKTRQRCYQTEYMLY